MRGATARCARCFYDADRPRAADDEVAWYARHASARRAASCSTLMCGSGRLLVPLARARRQVHGVDASPAMLARCEASSRARGSTAPLFRQDVAAAEPAVSLRRAFIAGGAFQLITDPARPRARSSACARISSTRACSSLDLHRAVRRRAAARRAAGRSAHGQARRRLADRAALGNDDGPPRRASRARRAATRTGAARERLAEEHETMAADVVCAATRSSSSCAPRASRRRDRRRDRAALPTTTRAIARDAAPAPHCRRRAAREP